MGKQRQPRRPRRRRLDLKKTLFVLPNLVTLASVFCGFNAIRIVAAPEASVHDFYRAAVLLIFAMLFDLLDGRVARMTKTQSAFGLQLDSRRRPVYHWVRKTDVQGQLITLNLGAVTDAENVERLKTALESVFEDPEIKGISASDLEGEYTAIQYVPPEGTFHIDIVSRLGETFGYEDIDTEEHLVEGVRVPVATPEMLYRMKKNTIRLQDRADADRIRRRFELPE